MKRLLSWVLCKIFPMADEPYVGIDYGGTEETTQVTLLRVEGEKIDILETFSFDSRLTS